MCDPMTVIGVGLSAAGQVAGFAGKSADTKAYNATAQQNAINAGVAASRQYSDEGRRLSSDVKQANQEGYQAIMKARQAKGMALASAGTSGFDASSISVNSILAGISNDEANAVNTVHDRYDDSVDSYKSRTTAEEAQAQGRINSMPYKDGPSPLGLALGIATSSFGAASKNPAFADKVNGIFTG